MRRLHAPLLALLLLYGPSSGAEAGETGYAARDVEVRPEPRNDAPVTARLAKGARYELLERKLSWARIRIGAGEGWTLFFFLMSGDAPSSQSPGLAVSELWKLGTDRQGSGGGITATIGTRGLDDAQLASARFNGRELEQLESMGVPAPAGASFAAEGGLASRQVEPLGAPAALAGASGGSN